MFSVNIKKSTILFSLTALLFPILISSSFLENLNTRNLQDYIKYSSGGVYYLIDFPKNDITGTGDKLQDVPYKTLCIIKNCPSTCCTGEINELVCGTQEQCKQFYDNSIVGNVVAAIILPIFFIAIFFIAFHCFYKRSKNWALSALLAFCCMFILTIPIVIWYIWKFKPFGEDEEKKEYLFLSFLKKNLFNY